MTCIVGFVEGDTVWIGADSAGVSGDWGLSVRKDGKLFRNGQMLFGFTSSFRMGQLLQHALTIPDHDPRVVVEKYMATTFINAVRECLKSNGWASKDKEMETGGTFLVGYQGRLFHVEDDYQVGEAATGFDACGCGYQIARGALFASTEQGEARVLAALRAAEAFSAGVRGPFRVEALKKGPTS